MNLTSKIGLGTVQFGTDYGISNEQGKTKPEEVKAILNYAREAGIETIDTASAYGNAEEVLGQNDLKSFGMVSKFMPPDNGPVTDQLNSTLKSLQIEQLHGYLAHRPQAILENPDEWKRLNNLKDKGLIRKIGFSLNRPDELDILWSKGFYPDLIQVPYNIIDHRFEEWMIFLKEKGCEIHTRSAFLQGLFFMKPDQLDTFFDDVKPILSKLKECNASLTGLLLNHCLEKSFIDRVILGVNNVSQLKSNLDSLNRSEQINIDSTEISENILIPSNWPKEKTIK